jgi:hypothetical protein
VVGKRYLTQLRGKTVGGRGVSQPAHHSGLDLDVPERLASPTHPPDVSPESRNIAGAQADVVIGTDDLARFLL